MGTARGLPSFPLSGETLDELHGLVDHLGVALAHALGYTGFQVVAQQHLGNGMHGAFRRRKLREHIAAIAVVIDHALHAIELADGAIQAFLQLSLKLFASLRCLVAAFASALLRLGASRAALLRFLISHNRFPFCFYAEPRQLPKTRQWQIAWRPGRRQRVMGRASDEAPMKLRRAHRNLVFAFFAATLYPMGVLSTTKSLNGRTFPPGMAHSRTFRILSNLFLTFAYYASPYEQPEYNKEIGFKGVLDRI